MKAALLIFFRSVASYAALVLAGFCLCLLLGIDIGWDARRGVTNEDTKAKPLIVIDAGHGGQDGGGVANKLIEKTAALDIALRLKVKLEAADFSVKMTRERDTFLPLEDRAAIANKANADAFISLHLNTALSGDAAAKGIETYFSVDKSLAAIRLIRQRADVAPESAFEDRRGENLAETIQRAVCARTGAADRGVKERNYSVVRHTACPSALVECGFMTNIEEARKLRQDDYKDRIATGVAEGIRKFLIAQTSEPSRGLVVKDRRVARVKLVAKD